MGFSMQWEERYKESTHLSIWPWSDIVSLTMRYGRDKVTPAHRILELGCGAGANIPFFLSREAQYFGLDGSASIIDSLKSRYSDIAEHLAASDFTRDFVFDGKFDVFVDRASITCNAIEDIDRTLKMIRERANPGALLIGVDWYSTQNTEYQWGEPIADEHTRIFKTKGEFINTGKVHFFDKERLTDALDGFELLHLEHKSKENYIPKGDGYNFCSWNFVAKVKS